MRDVEILCDHQRSARKKAKDSVALRLALACANVVGRMEADSLSLCDVGDTVSDGDPGQGRGSLHSFSIDHLTQSMTADDDRGIPEV